MDAFLRPRTPQFNIRVAGGKLSLNFSAAEIALKCADGR